MKGSFAGIIEAEEENGIFCQLSDHIVEVGKLKEADLLYLLHIDIGLWLGDTSSTPLGRREQ